TATCSRAGCCSANASRRFFSSVAIGSSGTPCCGSSATMYASTAQRFRDAIRRSCHIEIELRTIGLAITTTPRRRLSVTPSLEPFMNLVDKDGILRFEAASLSQGKEGGNGRRQISYSKNARNRFSVHLNRICLFERSLPLPLSV